MSRGELTTGRASKRHPYDWCVDESWVAWQLFVALGGFAEEKAAGEAIWDGSAGSGRTMVTFAENGFTVFTSDIVRRLEPDLFGDAAAGVVERFFSADFLECEAAPAPCSIVGNPPYSYIKRRLGGVDAPEMFIGEAFVRHALRLTSRRVCMLLPIKWLASEGRFKLFMEDRPPQAVLVLCERPSMPPGDMIAGMGNKAFSGGAVDYAWYVWDVTRPTASGDTRVIWLPPIDQPALQRPIPALISTPIHLTGDEA